MECVLHGGHCMYGRGAVHGVVLEFFLLLEIDEQFCTLPIPLIAKRLRISAPRLQHLLKRDAGMSCTTVIRTRRVIRACDMLVRFPEKNITEIALLCEYEPKTMYRHFIAVFGKS